MTKHAGRGPSGIHGEACYYYYGYYDCRIRRDDTGLGRQGGFFALREMA